MSFSGEPGGAGDGAAGSAGEGFRPRAGAFHPPGLGVKMEEEEEAGPVPSRAEPAAAVGGVAGKKRAREEDVVKGETAEEPAAEPVAKRAKEVEPQVKKEAAGAKAEVASAALAAAKAEDVDESQDKHGDDEEMGGGASGDAGDLSPAKGHAPVGDRRRVGVPKRSLPKGEVQPTLYAYGLFLPMARIRRLVACAKGTPVVSMEAVTVIGKAAELFAGYLGERSYLVAQSNHARSIKPEHIDFALTTAEQLRFLRDTFQSLPPAPENESDPAGEGSETGGTSAPAPAAPAATSAAPIQSFATVSSPPVVAGIRASKADATNAASAKDAEHTVRPLGLSPAVGPGSPPRGIVSPFSGAHALSAGTSSAFSGVGSLKAKIEPRVDPISSAALPGTASAFLPPAVLSAAPAPNPVKIEPAASAAFTEPAPATTATASAPASRTVSAPAIAPAPASAPSSAPAPTPATAPTPAATPAPEFAPATASASGTETALAPSSIALSPIAATTEPAPAPVPGAAAPATAPADPVAASEPAPAPVPASESAPAHDIPAPAAIGPTR